MGLLGMLVAGGAMGARDASNQNVQAQNQLEIENARESIRQQFYDRRYQQRRADNMDAMKSKALLDQSMYERKRADQMTDTELKHQLEMAKIGANLKGKMAIEDRRDKRALLKNNSGSAEDGGFNPRSMEGKRAADLVESGRATDLNDAYDQMQEAGLFSNLARNQFLGSPKALFDFIDDYKRQKASRGGGIQQNPSAQNILKYNPQTGGF
jgi:hypothetical protein